MERVCKSWRAAALKVPSSLAVDPAAVDNRRPLRAKHWLQEGLRRLAARNVQTLRIAGGAAKAVPEWMPGVLAEKLLAQLRRYVGPKGACRTLRGWVAGAAAAAVLTFLSAVLAG